MPKGLEILRDVFGDDFTNFGKKASPENNIEQYFEMKVCTIIAHLPTLEDTQTYYQLLSRKFRPIDRKELYVKVTLRYPDAELTDQKIMYLDEERKQQIRRLQQAQEQEHLRNLDWLKAKVMECHGDFTILSGDNVLVNGLVAIEKEKAEVKKGIEELQQHLESTINRWFNDPGYKTIDPAQITGRLGDLQRELGKAQNLLVLAKKHALTKEVEELQALIKLLPEKEAQCQESLIKIVSEQFEKQFPEMEKSFPAFLQDFQEEVGQFPINTYEQVSVYREYDYEFHGWVRRLKDLLYLAEQLKLADKMQVIKDLLSTLLNIEQQAEKYEKNLEEACHYASYLLDIHRRVSFAKLKRNLHVSDEELADLLETLIDKGDIQAHIEGTSLYRK